MKDKKGAGEEIKKIINFAPKKMKDMLSSVYSYNERFLLDKEQEKLLEKIIFVMSQIDRRYFVKDEEKAYDDNALDIDAGQTISQPSTVARMLLLAEIEAQDDILEIGTGSGWNAALIALLCYPGNVTSIERVASLVEKAEKNVNSIRGFFKQKKQEDAIKLSKLSFHAENIFDAEKARKKKYDKIIFTAGIASESQEKQVEKLASDLLKQQGILICPRVSGKMLIIKKEKGLKKYNTKEEYVFVPLIYKQ